MMIRSYQVPIGSEFYDTDGRRIEITSSDAVGFENFKMIVMSESGTVISNVTRVLPETLVITQDGANFYLCFSHAFFRNDRYWSADGNISLEPASVEPWISSRQEMERQSNNRDVEMFDCTGAA